MHFPGLHRWASRSIAILGDGCGCTASTWVQIDLSSALYCTQSSDTKANSILCRIGVSRQNGESDLFCVVRRGGRREPSSIVISLGYTHLHTYIYYTHMHACIPSRLVVMRFSSPGPNTTYTYAPCGSSRVYPLGGGHEE